VVNGLHVSHVRGHTLLAYWISIAVSTRILQWGWCVGSTNAFASKASDAFSSTIIITSWIAPRSARPPAHRCGVLAQAHHEADEIDWLFAPSPLAARKTSWCPFAKLIREVSPQACVKYVLCRALAAQVFKMRKYASSSSIVDEAPDYKAAVDFLAGAAGHED